MKNHNTFSSFCLLVGLLLTSLSAQSQECLLIRGQPTWTKSNQQPYPFEILRLVDNAIESVLADSSKWVYYVDTYQRDSTLLVAYGETAPVTLELISFSGSMSERTLYSSEERNPIAGYTLVTDQSQAKYVEIRDLSLEARATPENRLVSIDQSKELSYSVLRGEVEHRLSGAASPYLAAPSNGTVAVHLLGRTFGVRNSIIPLGLNELPDTLIDESGVRFWRMIANERDFAAVLPLLNHKSESRPLLIYDKVKEEWISMTIPGGDTSARLINGKLVGVIAGTNPRSDPEIFVKHPCVPTSDAVIIDPIDHSQFIVTLGALCEVLWIERGHIIYRLDDKLYRARIEDKSLVERELIVTDPIVREIHWAMPAPR